MTDLREVVQTAVNEAAATDGKRPDLLVGEYVLIAAANGFDDDGAEVSQVVVVPDGGSLSRIVGLVEQARVQLQADVLATYDGGM